MKILRSAFVGLIVSLALLGSGLIVAGSQKLRATPSPSVDVSRVLCPNLVDEEVFAARMRALALHHASDADAPAILREIDAHYLRVDHDREHHC